MQYNNYANKNKGEYFMFEKLEAVEKRYEELTKEMYATITTDSDSNKA